MWYDKKVVKAIVKIIARYPVGTKVKLNIGSDGIVVSQTEDANHPIIAVLNEDGTLSSKYHNLKKDKNVFILGIKE